MHQSDPSLPNHVPCSLNPIPPPTLSPKWPLTCSGSPELCLVLAFCENEILRHILSVARIFPLAWQSRDLSLDGGVNLSHLKMILLLLRGAHVQVRGCLCGKAGSPTHTPRLTWVPGLELSQTLGLYSKCFACRAITLAPDCPFNP